MSNVANKGLVVGSVGVLCAAAKIWSPAVGVLELLFVAWFIYRAAPRGETFGTTMKFVLGMMFFAGIIYGAGYYFLVNHFAAGHFEAQLESAYEAVKVEVDRGLVRRMMASPLYWLFYGVLAEVFYGGIVGLFVVPFVRKR